MYTEVTPYEKEDIEKKERLEEGVYVWGQYLEVSPPHLTLDLVNKTANTTMGRVICPSTVTPTVVAPSLTRGGPSRWLLKVPPLALT